MSSKSPITNNTLFVLGSGVDVAMGLPTMDDLLSELARFSDEEGKGVEKAIRKHVKGIKFNIRKRAGDQGEQFGELLISSHSHLIDKVKSALDKHAEQNSPKVKAMHTIVDNLDDIRKSNHLDDDTCAALAEMAGEKEGNAGSDYLFNPRGLTLTNAPRQAIRNMFQGALTEIEGLTDDEKKAMHDIVHVVSNFEEMLGEFFSGFFTKHPGKQKKYFYLSWLLWAYLKAKQFDAVQADESFYKTLASLDNHNVITFNYTRFFLTEDYSNIAYFHGSCDGYIRFDTRELIEDDDRVTNAHSIDDLEAFINELGDEIDWKMSPRGFSSLLLFRRFLSSPLFAMSIWTGGRRLGGELLRRIVS